MNPFKSLFFLFIVFLGIETNAQKAITVAFYNLENLFDTANDPNTFDDDYTPKGRHHWTSTLLTQKIDNLAKVIVEIGKKETHQAPFILGVAEVENRVVLDKLIAHPLLKPFQYEIIHFDSPDARGIDVSLLYRPALFTLENAKKYTLKLVDPSTQNRRTTRDQLLVSGFVGSEELTVFVNHWPSRRGGQKRSEAGRIKAATLQQRIVDSVQRVSPKGKIIILGDFNDNPTNRSLKILTQKNDFRPLFQPLFNPMEKLFKNGIGSLAYRDRWFLFDQILISKNFKSKKGLRFVKAAVFNRPYLKTPEGKYKGYPFRNQIKGTQLLGYSDHFPVYIILAAK
jgi:hypothetical protein